MKSISCNIASPQSRSSGRVRRTTALSVRKASLRTRINCYSAKAGRGRTRFDDDGTCSRAYRSPSTVSRYMCLGGLPGSVCSQRVARMACSAKRIKIGYNVPDFKPVFRLMSYPYFQSLGW
jgi:hypothetical protein